jgi:hypothetical protein
MAPSFLKVCRKKAARVTKAAKAPAGAHHHGQQLQQSGQYRDLQLDVLRGW